MTDLDGSNLNLIPYAGLRSDYVVGNRSRASAERRARALDAATVFDGPVDTVVRDSDGVITDPDAATVFDGPVVVTVTDSLMDSLWTQPDEPVSTFPAVVTLDDREAYMLQEALQVAIAQWEEESEYAKIGMELSTLLAKLPASTLNWDEFNAEPVDERPAYYVFHQYDDLRNYNTRTALPVTPELTDYLFTQRRRRIDNALLAQIAPLAVADKVSSNYPGTPEFNEDVRNALNINNGGLRYRGDHMRLIEHKTAVLGHLAPVVNDPTVLNVAETFYTDWNTLPTGLKY